VRRRRRGPDFFDNYQRVLDHAARTRPDLVVHGGDFFAHSRVHRPIVDRAYAALVALAQGGVPVFIVPGNHERSRLPHSLWLAEPGIHVFDRPRTFRLAARGVTVGVSGFPFVREDLRRRSPATIEQTGWREAEADVRLLCMHQAAEGAQVAGYTFRSGSDVVRASDVPRDFAAVLAGHIHRAQVLGHEHPDGPPPTIYPGSVERTSFAERGDAKGFMELSFASDTANASSTPSSAWRMREARFVELPARPMVDLELDATLQPSDLRGHLVASSANVDRDAVVRIRCRGDARPALRTALRAALTASFLRSVFPSTMNVQLGAEFHPERRRRSRRARS
jgi:DNA repair exonuclease SbcCD nuclease subunit